MNVFLLITIAVTALDIFIIVFAFSLKFFSGEWKWKKKIKYVTVQQDTLIGLTLVFLTMLCCFLWVFYFYFIIFIPWKKLFQTYLFNSSSSSEKYRFSTFLFFCCLIFQLRLEMNKVTLFYISAKKENEKVFRDLGSGFMTIG